MKKYSFIIPVKEINDYVRDNISRILLFKRDDFEIIVYPDEITDEIWEKARQIATGRIGPAQKRNLAIRDAEGEILVFIDDDAYPQEDFLKVLEKDFTKKDIIAVGGPAVTPKESNFWQRVSGATFLSSLSGGFPERYRPVGKKIFVADWPTVHLSIRKKEFEDLGGFAGNYWPGEATKPGFDLLKKKNARILYNQA